MTKIPKGPDETDRFMSTLSKTHQINVMLIVVSQSLIMHESSAYAYGTKHLRKNYDKSKYALIKSFTE
jgi:hypothetical protein